MVLAEKLAHTRETRVGTATVELRTLTLGIKTHRAELVDIERTAETADTLLTEYSRTAVLQANGHIASQHQRREQHKAQKSYQHVDQALHITLKTVHAVGDKGKVIGHKILLYIFRYYS